MYWLLLSAYCIVVQSHSSVWMGTLGYSSVNNDDAIFLFFENMTAMLRERVHVRIDQIQCSNDSVWWLLGRSVSTVIACPSVHVHSYSTEHFLQVLVCWNILVSTGQPWSFNKALSYQTMRQVTINDHINSVMSLNWPSRSRLNSVRDSAWPVMAGCGVL